MARTVRSISRAADFGGDDGEPTTVFAGTGGFDCGVEGEQAGLVGDIVDELNNLADGLTGFAEPQNLIGGCLAGVDETLDGVDGAMDRFSADMGVLLGATRVGGGSVGRMADLFDRRGDVVHAGGDAGGLFLLEDGVGCGLAGELGEAAGDDHAASRPSWRGALATRQTAWQVIVQRPRPCPSAGSP